MKTLFAGPSDLAYPPVQRFARFLLSELIFLPWKVIPFYFLFYYLLPKYLKKGAYGKTGIYFLAVLIICLFGYRSMVSPVSNLMYSELPDFQIYSFSRMLYTLTDIIPAVGLAATVKLLRGQIAFQKKEKALQEEKLTAELNFLKAQTNPHFLFNTLNNLYGLARRNDQHTAASILKLSNIMRYILKECSAPVIPIRKEIKVIEDYMELEQLRYNDRLRVHLQCEIDNEKQPIAPLVLLPFVENAFKHGASEIRFAIEITIRVRLASGQLDFQVCNPFDPEEKESSQMGTGLQNVRRQLSLIYGQNHQLTIRPGSGHFSVHLQIDLRLHEG